MLADKDDKTVFETPIVSVNTSVTPQVLKETNNTQEEEEEQQEEQQEHEEQEQEEQEQEQEEEAEQEQEDLEHHLYYQQNDPLLDDLSLTLSDEDLPSEEFHLYVDNSPMDTDGLLFADPDVYQLNAVTADAFGCFVDTM